MNFDTVVKNGILVFPEGGFLTADIGIVDGKIMGIFDRSARIDAPATWDAEGKYVLPGIIDPHVHIGVNYPTAPEHFATETRSAAVGGVTTILSFVLKAESYDNCFPQFKELGERAAYVDFGFHFGAVTDEHIRQFKHYGEDLGVSSYKFFTNFRGEEGSYLGLSSIDDGFLFAVMEALGKLPNAYLCPHCENVEVIWLLRKRLMDAGREDLAAWTESRPALVETEVISRVLHFALATGCGVYVPHLTCKEALEVVERHRARFSRIYVETCPHYLTHTCDAPVGVLGKVNPALRSKEDVDSLWKGISEGSVNTIGSDHVPRPLAAKQQGNIWKAPAGFPGVATMLPVMLSEGVNKRRVSLQRIAELMSSNPAKIFNLYPRKGTIRVGSDADLTIVDLDMEKEVRAADLETAAGYSLYEGWSLKGWPVLTMVRGEVVMKDGKILGREGHGKYLPRI